LMAGLKPGWCQRSVAVLGCSTPGSPACWLVPALAPSPPPVLDNLRVCRGAGGQGPIASILRALLWAGIRRQEALQHIKVVRGCPSVHCGNGVEVRAINVDVVNLSSQNTRAFSIDIAKTWGNFHIFLLKCSRFFNEYPGERRAPVDKSSERWLRPEEAIARAA
jgi:hypothetical protein